MTRKELVRVFSVCVEALYVQEVGKQRLPREQIDQEFNEFLGGLLQYAHHSMTINRTEFGVGELR